MQIGDLLERSFYFDVVRFVSGNNFNELVNLNAGWKVKYAEIIQLKTCLHVCVKAADCPLKIPCKTKR